jgi:hypothetical protein
LTFAPLYHHLRQHNQRYQRIPIKFLTLQVPLNFPKTGLQLLPHLL